MKFAKCIRISYYYDMTIHYAPPPDWVQYDIAKVVGALTDAKAAVMSLTSVPYQRSWAEKLQEIQLKQEVAGTSRIEGAEFTESELDEAISGRSADESLTRSQKQARAAVNTYRWIAKLPKDLPISCDLICDIHRRIVTGCDDDHCEPGRLRQSGQNVVFGTPRHRGAEGGTVCTKAFQALCEALSSDFRRHDSLIQGLAIHYQIGAMHPFLDGNGRTARAVEALLLQRSGLKDALFISLSNYYYDEKQEYLSCLASVRQNNGDLTNFIIFGLKGVATQCRRLLTEINRNISKALYRDMANELFGTLRSPKKRILAKRQLSLLNYLLERGPTPLDPLFRELKHTYDLQDPYGGFIRDLISLRSLRAISVLPRSKEDKTTIIDVRLVWPTEITETDFFLEMQRLPKAKTHSFLQKSLGDQVSDLENELKPLNENVNI